MKNMVRKKKAVTTRRKRSSKAQITVMIGELVKPLIAKKCDAGTTLVDFLKDNGIKFSSNVRVGGETALRSYTLKNGDVITTIGSVSGGL